MPVPAPPAMEKRCLKAAFLLDEGEVETIAHYYAAAFFDPDVDCILDIGGQDMKCIQYQRRHRGQRSVERSLLLRLRFLYRNLRQFPELQRPGFREGRAVCEKSRSIWEPGVRFS